MKNKIAVLSICGLVSATATAQSNVTVYGIVDASLAYGAMGPNKVTQVRSGSFNASRLGFRGSEDLGNGTKAVFALEYGLVIDVSADIGNTRQSYIGLQNDRWGFLGLGRQYAPGFFVSPYSAMAAAGDFSVLSQLSGAANAMIRAGNQSRINNSINYKSPKLGGFEVNAIYGFGEAGQQGDRRRNDVAGIGVSYASGPLAASLIYQQKEGGRDASDQRDWFIGAAYDFGVAKVMGSYQQVKDARNDGDTDVIYQFGGIVPVSSSGSVHAAWGRLDSDRGSSFDIDAWNVTYVHTLSRRTQLYTGYLHIDNGRNTNLGRIASATANGVPLLGKDSRNLVAGIRHAF
ncbi:MAG: porin [Rhodocyclaceae bacterium]